jgi:hypothetical protein
MGGVLIQLALCFEVRAKRGCSRRTTTSIAVAGQINEDGILYQIQHTLGQQQPLAAGRAIKYWDSRRMLRQKERTDEGGGERAVRKVRVRFHHHTLRICAAMMAFGFA